MDTPRRFEQVINASGDINIDTGVQIGQDQSFDRQIWDLELSGFFKGRILLKQDLPELWRASFVINTIYPKVSDLLAELVILCVG